jgi:hypothetical protein
LCNGAATRLPCVASWPSTSAIDQLDVVRALGLVGGFELRLDAVELALRQPERT